MEEKEMGYDQKRRQYYDKVMDLYFNQDKNCNQISKILPISKTTASRWVAKFVAENQSLTPTAMKKKKAVVQDFEQLSKATQKAYDDLEAKYKEAMSELRFERMRAEAYSTMIDIAEKKFSIPIRKKAGAKQ